ncbi:MAG: hypothetical protein DLM61_14525 [Pseudonocardiales bacterium]|nr:MAG: hypothetical protein DLM61_14525 [Pseudonocardiales bacterium]
MGVAGVFFGGETSLVGSGRLPVAPLYEGASLSEGTSVVCEERAVVVSAGPHRAHGTPRPTFGPGPSPVLAVTSNGEIGTLAGNLLPPVGERGSVWTAGGLPGAGAGWVPPKTGPT